MKKLGVIGGMGPLASVYFYELLTKMQAVRCEQEYLDVLLYSVPSTPDRTAFVMGEGREDPTPSLTAVARVLLAAGVDLVAVPCVTAHFFYDAIESIIPTLHIVDETVNSIKEKGFIKAGLLGTNGTVNSRLFHEKLEKQGIDVITPPPEEQALLMKLIYQSVKRGKTADGQAFVDLSNALRKKGAQTVILGCTELSLITRDLHLNEGYTDALAILARAAINACGGELAIAN